MEHSSLLPLLDMLTLLNRNLTGTHLIHSNPHKSHQANGGIIRLNKNNRAGCDSGKVRLALGDTACVDGGCVAVADAFEQGFGEVCAVLHEGFLDGAADGRVPAVVGERGEKGLVDGSAGKLGGEGVVGEHVEGGVGLAFYPEAVAELDVVLEVEDFGFAAVGDDVVVVGGCDGADFGLEFTGDCDGMVSFVSAAGSLDGVWSYRSDPRI